MADTGRDLRLEDVTKRFGDFVAVDDLTLRVPPTARSFASRASGSEKSEKATWMSRCCH